MVAGVPRPEPTVFVVEIENLIDDCKSRWSICGTFEVAIRSVLDAADLCGIELDEQVMRIERAFVAETMCFTINEEPLL